jgi:predicted regulator of Ras-like GTPase activity (Roadblock/LC7/MglB family)
MTGTEANALVASVNGSLATLKDVGGILGSFVCTHSGRLVAREISDMFEDAVLAEAGSRLVRLGETFAAVGDDLEIAMVRFRDHRLYLKVIPGGMLCIMSDGPVNMPALRMAANLVSRRIAPSVARVQAELPPPGKDVPAAVAVATPEVERPSRPRMMVAPPGMRRFRGQDVE